MDVDASARSRFFFYPSRALVRARSHESDAVKSAAATRRGDARASHVAARVASSAKDARACTGRWQSRARAEVPSLGDVRERQRAKKRSLALCAPESDVDARALVRERVSRRRAGEDGGKDGAGGVTAALGVDDVEDEDPGKNFSGTCGRWIEAAWRCSMACGRRRRSGRF